MKAELGIFEKKKTSEGRMWGQEESWMTNTAISAMTYV